MSFVFALIFPTVAVMVSVPMLSAVAMPVPEVMLELVPPAAQATSSVMAAVLPSE